jgi:hypothetical protein
MVTPVIAAPGVPAVQITAIIDYGNELLVSLATQDAPLAGVFRITASTCS